jgi:hypothetical protein
MRATLTVITLAMFALALALGALGAGPRFYGVGNGTANAGFVIGDCYNYNLGFEFKGDPGFFTNQC